MTCTIFQQKTEVGKSIIYRQSETKSYDTWGRQVCNIFEKSNLTTNMFLVSFVTTYLIARGLGPRLGCGQDRDESSLFKVSR